MVEKVIISPTKVRAHGNIMMVKDLSDYTTYSTSLTESTDTINNLEQAVFIAEYESVSITIGFVSSEPTISIGESVLLTATVLEDNVAVEGASVSFKQAGNVLGTVETDASGVASLSFTPDASGLYSFVARYGTVESSRVWVTVNRLSTSTALSSSSASVYVGRDLTLSATVTTDGSGVEGLVVSFFDAGTLLDYATTDSNGVAGLVTNDLVVGEHTITAVVGETEAYSTSTSNEVSVSVEMLSLTVVLTSSAINVQLGTPITLTGSVTCENVAVSGVEVVFKDGDGVLGTGTTAGDGVASLTVAGLGTGTHSLSAVVLATDDFDGSVSSGVSVVVYNSSGDLDEYMRWIDYTDDLGNQSSDGEFLRGLDNMIQSINGRGDL